MYSIVLMVALTGSADAPTWGLRHGCHGCWGCYGCRGCWGCHGCYGCYGCHGCGGCYGCYGCHGCYGCYGCHGCHGYTVLTPVHMAPAHPTAPVAPEGLPPPKKADDAKKISATSAKVIVELPADAKLYIDDQPMKATSGQRHFRTPRLEEGQLYYYILRAEVVRDGERQSETKRVIVKAGETIQAAFPDLGIATAAAKAEARASR